MASSITLRVEALIALAVDRGAADNEARNAALSACKLIAQHNLRVVVRQPETSALPGRHHDRHPHRHHHHRASARSARSTSRTVASAAR